MDQRTLFCICYAFVALTHFGVAVAVKLEGYNVDPNSVTVSGLSAGGAMATQFHFAFSSEVKGAGVYAGLPYTCAKGGIADASQCMTIPDYFRPLNELITHAEKLSSDGVIDTVQNIRESKIYIFHGTKDSTVHPKNGNKIEQMYEHFGADIKTQFTLDANHGMPTDFYGAACSGSSAATQYINNCNYDGAYDMFNFLYGGGLVKPDTSINPGGELLEIDQGEFISGSPASISMDSVGFLYVPSGFGQLLELEMRSFATKTGYTHSAEANGIIVLFPQAVAMGLTNPNSCLDWWGYLNANFLTKQGAQMKAVQSMMHRLIDCPECESVTDHTSATTTITTLPPDGQCPPNQVVFSASPHGCQYYTLCACGANPVLLQCAQGLYFDPTIRGCNFMQLVNCDNDSKQKQQYYFG